MKTFIVIGAPGQGKSEWVKETIRNRRAFVFDVNNEYGGRTKYPNQKPLGFSNDPNATQARYTPKSVYLRDDARDFMLMCMKKKDTNIVFEEATVYLEGRQEELAKTLIVNRIHTGNVYYFLFHSISAVPPRIMQMASYVVLHKTVDEDYIVQYKYSRLFHHFLDLQPQPDGSRVIVKLM